LPATKKHGIAHAELELVGYFFRAFRPDVLGERTGAALLALAPEDIAETGLAFALRPGIHAIAEGAVAALRRGNGPHLRRRIGIEDIGKDLEAGSAERSLTSCITIGLRRSGLSVPYLRRARHKE
jgi:hypothetical protein